MARAFKRPSNKVGNNGVATTTASPFGKLFRELSHRLNVAGSFTLALDGDEPVVYGTKYNIEHVRMGGYIDNPPEYEELLPIIYRSHDLLRLPEFFLHGYINGSVCPIEIIFIWHGFPPRKFGWGVD